jgi:hypothetical protein
MIFCRVRPGNVANLHCKPSPPGTARCPGHVPGIVGRAVDRIVALPIGEHQRHIGLAKQNGASLLQTLRGQGARLGHVVGKLGIAQVVGEPATL